MRDHNLEQTIQKMLHALSRLFCDILLQMRRHSKEIAADCLAEAGMRQYLTVFGSRQSYIDSRCWFSDVPCKLLN